MWFTAARRRAAAPRHLDHGCLLPVMLVPALVCGLSGCTVVQVHGAQVQTNWVAGLAVVQVRPEPGQLALVQSLGLGLSVSQQGATLGLVRQIGFLADAGHACGTFIVTQGQAQAIALREWLSQQGQAALAPCVVHPPKE